MFAWRAAWLLVALVGCSSNGADTVGGTAALGLPAGARGVCFLQAGMRRIALWAETPAAGETAAANLRLPPASRSMPGTAPPRRPIRLVAWPRSRSPARPCCSSSARRPCTRTYVCVSLCLPPSCSASRSWGLGARRRRPRHPRQSLPRPRPRLRLTRSPPQRLPRRRAQRLRPSPRALRPPRAPPRAPPRRPSPPPPHRRPSPSRVRRCRRRSATPRARRTPTAGSPGGSIAAIAARETRGRPAEPGSAGAMARCASRPAASLAARSSAPTTSRPKSTRPGASTAAACSRRGDGWAASPRST